MQSFSKKGNAVGRNAKKIGFWIGLTTLAGILAACRSQVIHQLTPPEIIFQSAEHMKGLAGFDYLIERSGEIVFLNYEETIGFSRAAGQYEAPDNVVANVRLIMPGMISEVKIISINGIQWDTNLLTEKWELTDPLYSFNPSVLFDAENGIQVMLAGDMIDPVLVGLEELKEVPGKKLYAIEAALNGEHAYIMSYGMIDNEALKIKIWVDPNTFDLNRIVIVDPANSDGREATTWQIDFWNFGKKYNIEPPSLENQ